MWKTQVLYLLILINILQVDRVFCRKGKTSSDDESLESFRNGSSSEHLTESGHHITLKAHDNDGETHKKHEYASAANSTTPKTPLRLTNSTSISTTSAAFENSTSGPSPTTGSPSLSLNTTTGIEDHNVTIEHGKHEHTSEDNSTTPSLPKLTNSTASANSTLGLGSTTEHHGINASTESSGNLTTQGTTAPSTTLSSLKSSNSSTVGVQHTTSISSITHAQIIEHGSSNSGINSTKKRESTTSSSRSSTTQIPNNGTESSAHGHHHGYNISTHHLNSTESPHDRNSTGIPKDSSRISKYLKSSSLNSTTKSLRSNRTSPNPSTASPINKTTSSSSHQAKSTRNSTGSPGESLETIKSMKFGKEEHFKSGDSVITEVEFREVKKSLSSLVVPHQYGTSLAPLKLALARDAMESHTKRKDSRDIHGSTGKLNGTIHGGNSTGLANSTIAHINSTSSANSTASSLHNSTGIHGNTTASTLLHNSTLPANSTASTLLHNSTLPANSTALSLHCNSTTNCTADNTNTSSSPPSREPQVMKITSDTVFNFMINHTDTGIPCLLANMSIDLKALYAKSDQTISKGSIHVPNTAKSNGTCTGRRSRLMLIWKEKGKSKVKRAITNSNDSLENFLIFDFINDGKNSKVDKIQASVVLDPHNFPNSSAKIVKGESKSGLGLFSSRVDATAYVCNAPTEVKAGDIDVFITNIALIAFNSKKDLSSIKVESCQEHKGLNIGAVIGGFIVVALLISIGLYLIAWRKKKSYRSSQIP